MDRTIRKSLPRQQTKLIPPLFIGAGLLLIGLATFFILPKPDTSAQSKEEISAIPAVVEYAAPELSLVDLQGNEVALIDYRGTVVLLNNWATWCPPCKAEMPTFESFYQEHQEKGFTIVAVEAGQPREEVARFVDQYNLSFPIWLDARSQALDAFRNQRLPSSYLIDREGVVRLAWTGAISRPMLDKYVIPLLED